MNDDAHIGYLIAYPGFAGVCCHACLDASDMRLVYDLPAQEPKPARLYRINVYPYRQTCHGCGKTLVEPQSSLWPELFVKPEAK